MEELMDWQKEMIAQKVDRADKKVMVSEEVELADWERELIAQSVDEAPLDPSIIALWSGSDDFHDLI